MPRAVQREEGLCMSVVPWFLHKLRLPKSKEGSKGWKGCWKEELRTRHCCWKSFDTRHGWEEEILRGVHGWLRGASPKIRLHGALCWHGRLLKASAEVVWGSRGSVETKFCNFVSRQTSPILLFLVEVSVLPEGPTSTEVFPRFGVRRDRMAGDTLFQRKETKC